MRPLAVHHFLILVAIAAACSEADLHADLPPVRDPAEVRRIVTIDERWGAIDALGRERIPFNFDLLTGNQDESVFCGYRQGEGWVVMDADGRIRLGPLDHDFVEPLPNGLLLVCDHDGAWGVMADDRQMVLEPRFDAIMVACEEAFWVLEGDHWGLISISGQLLHEPVLDNVLGFAQQRAVVVKGDRWGVIDEKGDLVVPWREQPLAPLYSEGLIAFRDDSGRWGYMDRNGHTVIEPAFESVSGFREGGLARVRIDGLHGYCDREGNLVIPARFELARPFHGNLAPVKLGPRNLGFIDRDGEPVLQGFRTVSRFSDGLAYTIRRENGRDVRGFIDKRGRLVICQDAKGLTGVGSFFEGIAPVTTSTHFGYIDRKGKWVWKVERERTITGVGPLMDRLPP